MDQRGPQYLYNERGGAISDNTCEVLGGGVFLQASTFIMTGGTISGNTTSEDFGGGVSSLL
jgi:hypothetical protein